MPFQNEAGVKIKLNIGKDITTAEITEARIYYVKPTGTSGYWPAEKESANEISYTTATGDLDFTGTIKAQAWAKIEKNEYFGTVAKISVSGTLKQ